MEQHQPKRWEELERTLLPPEALPGSLEAHLVRPPTAGMWLFWGLALSTVAALVWAAFAELDITIRCRGYIRPTTPSQTLRSPIDGIVEAVPIQLYQHVRRGDTLLRFRSAELQLRRSVLEEELRHEEQMVADLLALARSLPTGGTPPQIAAQLPVLSWRTPQVRSLWELIRKDLNLFARRYETLSQRRDRIAALREKQFATAEEYESVLTELRLQELQVLQYLQARRQELLQRVDELEHRQRELRQQLELLQERLRQTVLVSNVDGQVVRLSVSRPGTYVTAGQELVTITPEARLEVELLVLPEDITLVQPGQRVRLSVVGLPLGEWEPLWGRVESIAEDISAEGTALVYRVRAVLDTTVLRSRSAAASVQIQLRKGLPVQATIYVGRKPFTAWLYDRSRHLWHSVAP
ncbi:MAG: HlyD family efflux transporter periplasmic adaptor subunit [Chlorobiota bacterium]